MTNNDLCGDQASLDEKNLEQFTRALANKLAEARAKGYSGWEDPKKCSIEYLAQQFFNHLKKSNEGNFLDLAAFLMMLHQRRADPECLIRGVVHMHYPRAMTEPTIDDVEQYFCAPILHNVEGKTEWSPAAIQLLNRGISRGTVTPSDLPEKLRGDDEFVEGYNAAIETVIHILTEKAKGRG